MHPKSLSKKTSSKMSVSWSHTFCFKKPTDHILVFSLRLENCFQRRLIMSGEPLSEILTANTIIIHPGSLFLRLGELLKRPKALMGLQEYWILEFQTDLKTIWTTPTYTFILRSRLGLPSGESPSCYCKKKKRKGETLSRRVVSSTGETVLMYVLMYFQIFLIGEIGF